MVESLTEPLFYEVATCYHWGTTLRTLRWAVKDNTHKGIKLKKSLKSIEIDFSAC